MSDVNAVDMQELPSIDDFMEKNDPDANKPLPSLDEFMEKHDPSTPRAFYNYAREFSPIKRLRDGGKEFSEAQRIWAEKQPFYNTVKALGSGYAKSVKENSGLDEETYKALSSANLWGDYEEGEKITNNAIMDSLIIPATQKLYRSVAPTVALMGRQASAALLHGPMDAWDAMSEQIGEELHNEEIGRDLGNLPENAFESLEAAGFRIPHLPPVVAKGKAAGVFEDEAVFMGLKEPHPNAAAEMNAAARMYPEESAVIGKSEIGKPPRTVHEEARVVAPEVFEKYDNLVTQRDTLGQTLRDATRQRLEDAHTNSPFAAEITDLEKRLETANARYQKIYGERLDGVREKHQEWVDEAVRQDTPELAKAREEYQKVDYATRDLAPEVSAAYRQAEKNLPAVVEEIKPTIQEEAAVTPGQQEIINEAPALEKAAEQVAEGEKSGPNLNEAVSVAPKTIEEQKAFIADDIVKQVVATGRPEAEARLIGQLEAARYETLSKIYPKFSAERWYAREAAEIEAGKSRGAMGANGKIRLATDQNKATIKIFGRADASTLIHEKGHEWTEQLIRLAKADDAPAAMKRDADALKKWAGYSDEVGDTKAAKSAQTKAQEKFARGFERYLMEGVAPSKELAHVFDAFKQWLISIYQTVQNLKAPITDDIRDVFDRLLAANPEKTVIAADRVVDELPKATEIPKEVAAAETGAVSAQEEITASPQNAERIAEDAVPGTTTEMPVEKPVVPEVPENPNAQLGTPKSDLVDKAGNIRLDNLNTPEDVNAVLKQVASENDDFITARRNVISDSQVLDLADSLGMSPEMLNMRKIGETFNAEQIVAARKLLIQSAVNVRDVMNKVAESGTDEAVMAYAEAKARHIMIQEQVAGITAEAGRALRAFRELEGGAEAKLVGDFLKETTGKDLNQLRREAELGAKLDTPQQLSKFLNDSKKANFSDMVLEFWINSLLSGPMTHVKNVLGNAVMALFSVAETSGAAGVGNIRRVLGNTEERVILGEAQARAFGFTQGAVDGLKAAAKVLQDENFVSGAHTLETAQRPRAIPGKVGEVVRIPGRLLTAEDELFKAIAYRQELNAVAYRTAFKENLTGDAFNQRMADIVMNPSEEIMTAARANAEYQTYVKKLGPVGSALQKFANSHPLMKMIIPFIRTPTNILKYAGERTPLAVFSKEVRENLSGAKGKIAQDTQIARMVIGTSIIAATASLSAQGILTGGGPSDSKAKAALRLTGWQPYSLKIGNMYYSYQWLEPFSTIAGVTADAHDISKESSEEEDSNLAAMLFASVSKNMMSKLSLRGASDLINAATDPDRFGPKYLQNLAGTAVPSLVANIARTADPTMRQTRSTIDAIKARVPGLRNTLLPVRDVWGEPIVREGNLGPDLLSPIYETRVNKDPVNKALISSGYFPSQPERKIRGVELTDQQYDDMTRIAGRLAKNQLNNIVNHPGFETINVDARHKLIKNIIDNSRERARKVIMLQNPEIPRKAVENKRRSLGKSN